jgi:hypothetical protein
MHVLQPAGCRLNRLDGVDEHGEIGPVALGQGRARLERAIEHVGGIAHTGLPGVGLVAIDQIDRDEARPRREIARRAKPMICQSAHGSRWSRRFAADHLEPPTIMAALAAMPPFPAPPVRWRGCAGSGPHCQR